MMRRLATFAAAASLASLAAGVAAARDYTLHIVTFPDDAGSVYAVSTDDGAAAGYELRPAIAARFVEADAALALIDAAEGRTEAWAIIGSDADAATEDAEAAAQAAAPDFVRIKDVEGDVANAFIADIPSLSEAERARLKAALGL